MSAFPPYCLDFTSLAKQKTIVSLEIELAFYNGFYKHLGMVRETIQTDSEALLAIVKDSGQFD